MFNGGACACDNTIVSSACKSNHIILPQSRHHKQWLSRHDKVMGGEVGLSGCFVSVSRSNFGSLGLVPAVGLRYSLVGHSHTKAVSRLKRWRNSSLPGLPPLA